MKYNRMLTTVRDKIEEIDDLWRDIHFPPETASIALVYRLLAMKRLDPTVAEFLESKGKSGPSKVSLQTVNIDFWLTHITM